MFAPRRALELAKLVHDAAMASDPDGRNVMAPETISARAMTLEINATDFHAKR